MISKNLGKASRWVFFAALAYAPWAYGATTAESIRVTNALLLVALVLWSAELLTRAHWPDIPPSVVILTSTLLCVAGWMTLNAKFIYDSEFSVFVPLRSLAPGLTGSVDYANSAAWMLRGGLLLCATLFVSDLSQSSRWFLRLWYVIGLVGGSIAFLGLLQKATGAQMIFWQPPPPSRFGVRTFFATYFYHGNAGAFLNLVWPLSAGLVIRAFTSHSQPGMRALWTIVFVVTIGSVLANTSRMAQFVALALTGIIGLHFGPTLLQLLPRAHKSVLIAGMLAVLLAFIALAQAIHLEQPLNRWQSFGEQLPADARWQAFRVALAALPGSGFFGFGPATFRVVFPGYNIGSGHPVPGSWRFLHQDYLQTVLEWGWLGSTLWAMLFFGGLAVAIFSYRRYAMRSWLPRRRVMQPLVVTALLGVAIHALVDFPFQIESLQLYVATYLGVCWGSRLWCDKSELRRDRSETVAKTKHG